VVEAKAVTSEGVMALTTMMDGIISGGRKGLVIGMPTGQDF